MMHNSDNDLMNVYFKLTPYNNIRSCKYPTLICNSI